MADAEDGGKSETEVTDVEGGEKEAEKADDTGTAISQGIDEANDKVGTIQLGNEDGQYGQSQAGCSDSEITAVCRWQSLKSLEVYQRLTPEDYARMLQKEPQEEDDEDYRSDGQYGQYG